MAQRGVWDGRAVVPPDWLDDATSHHSDTYDPAFEFGFYWWRVPELDAVAAWGVGGNFIFIAPTEGIVIVMVSMPDVNDDIVGTTLGDFLPLARTILGSVPPAP